MKPALLALAAFGLTTTVALAADKPESHAAEYLSSEQNLKANLPFSEVVRLGNTLYLSGVIGFAPGTRTLVPGGIEGQTRQVMESIKSVLERNGSSLDHVVKCTVMLADMSEWAKMNAIYVTYFTKHFPARSALGVNGLALGAQVEIECIATVGDAG
ncbi:MAG: Rid family detoxifying hydrolase [Pseudomonadota bacterium]